MIFSFFFYFILEEIKIKSKNSFKRLVKVKVKQYTFNYLMGLKTKHTKMDKVNYKELKLQNYLKDNSIPVIEARNIFRYRTRVAKYKENMKSSYLSTACPLWCVQLDTQVHSVQCSVVKEHVQVEGNYNDIYSENIPSDISRTLLRISKFREDYF